MVTQPTATNWIFIALLGIIWGGTFMVVSVALEGYGPITVASARTALGAVAMISVAVALGRPMPSRAVLPYLLIIGPTNTAIPYFLLSWGQQHVPSAFAGITMAALPLFVLPLAHFFTDERLTTRRLVGVLIGFAGALWLIGPSALRPGAGIEGIAQLACLLAALFYAVSSILTRRCPPIDPLTMGAMTLLIGSIFLVPIMLLTEGVPQWSGGISSYAIVFLGIVPTALATFLRTSVIRSAGAVFMTLVNYQVPVWSLLFGTLLLNEDLPLRFYGALGLILIGLATSQWQSLRRVFGR